MIQKEDNANTDRENVRTIVDTENIQISFFVPLIITHYIYLYV